MPDRIEIWFEPTGGFDGERMLLESRDRQPGETMLPHRYAVGSKMLLAGSIESRPRPGGGTVWMVKVVDPDYCQ